MPIYRKINLLALLLFLALSGCEKETNVELSAKNPQLVVLGEFNQQDDALINLSTSVFSAAAAGFPNVEDAQISLLDQNNTLIEKYLYMGKGNYMGKKAIAGKNYKLSVAYQGKTYQAETTIPPAFQLNLLEQDSTYMEAEIVDLSTEPNFYTFELRANRYTVDRYYLANGQKVKVNSEAEFTALLKTNPALVLQRDTTFDAKFDRLFITTDDNRTENVRFNVLKDHSGRIFLTDKTFNGNKTTLEIDYDQSTLKAENMRYTLVVKSTSAAYFNYLYSIDLQAAKSIVGVLDVPVKGNISDAFGIWGAAYIQKIIIKK
ncbi:DUF4249 family protein [Pedobacter cryoconitis]|uniref:DUF4249 family protein n=1 Tax=Pedobacter cryoconitis TaxID=188932 RepID=UPI00161EFED7|nr:DUF4249 family protein [Pedobacter cryoconitis]MBB5644976.1 hypothetical protein [Pedobacter cryoconitis]